MMDDKRLQEIKARVEAAVYDCDYMELESLALHSIPDLIAEVERLREQERLWSDGHIIVKLTDAEAENARLRAELEVAKEVIGRACVWLDLHRKDGVDDVLRALSGFLSATENGGQNEQG